MMSSKAFAFLGLLFAFAVLIAPEVAARDLAPTSPTNKDDDPLKAIGVGTGIIDWGGYGGDYLGEGNYGGYYDGDYGRGRCRFGCCGYHSKCYRCCNYVGEVADTKP